MNLEIQEEKIFKIFAGQDEVEYYSNSLPIFEEDNTIAILNKDVTVKKVSLKVDLPLDKQLEIGYAEKLEEDRKIYLDEGIIIKCVNKNAIEEWFNRSQKEAEEQVKDEELAYYRMLLPQILKKVNLNSPNRVEQPKNNRLQI